MRSAYAIRPFDGPANERAVREAAKVFPDGVEIYPAGYRIGRVSLDEFYMIVEFLDARTRELVKDEQEAARKVKEEAKEGVRRKVEGLRANNPESNNPKEKTT